MPNGITPISLKSVYAFSIEASILMFLTCIGCLFNFHSIFVCSSGRNQTIAVAAHYIPSFFHCAIYVFRSFRPVLYCSPPSIFILLQICLNLKLVCIVGFKNDFYCSLSCRRNVEVIKICFNISPIRLNNTLNIYIS